MEGIRVAIVWDHYKLSATKMHVRFFWWTFTPLLDIVPGMEVLGHQTGRYLTLVNIAKVSKVAIPIYVPASSMRQFWWLHTLASTCNCQSCWFYTFWWGYGGISCASGLFIRTLEINILGKRRAEFYSWWERSPRYSRNQTPGLKSMRDNHWLMCAWTRGCLSGRLGWGGQEGNQGHTTLQTVIPSRNAVNGERRWEGKSREIREEKERDRGEEASTY